MARVSKEAIERNRQNSRIRVAERVKRIAAEFRAGIRNFPETATCTACSETKPHTEFGHCYNHLSGLKNWCKKCEEVKVAMYKEKSDALLKRYSHKAHVRKKLSRWHEILFDNAKRAAPKRGLAFEIPNPAWVRDLWDKQGGKCYWFGIDLELRIENRHPSHPSLERIDCAKGYTTDNVVLCSIGANFARRDTTVPDWLDFLAKLGVKTLHKTVV